MPKRRHNDDEDWGSPEERAMLEKEYKEFEKQLKKRDFRQGPDFALNASIEKIFSNALALYGNRDVSKIPYVLMDELWQFVKPSEERCFGCQKFTLHDHDENENTEFYCPERLSRHFCMNWKGETVRQYPPKRRFCPACSRTRKVNDFCLFHYNFKQHCNSCGYEHCEFLDSANESF